MVACFHHLVLVGFVIDTMDDVLFLLRLSQAGGRERSIVNEIFGGYLRSQGIILHVSFVMRNKGPNIFVPLLTAKPEQQWLTVRSGILTSISRRQCSVVSSRPLPERTDFRPAVCS